LILSLIAFFLLRRRQQRQRRLAEEADVFTGKPELSADEAQRRIIEKDGACHADRNEMLASTKLPAELSPGVNAKSSEPQESPGGAVKP